MAFISTNNTVETTATVIAQLPVTMGQGRAVSFQNTDAQSIFVGNSDVTTSGAKKGHIVLAGQTYQLWLSGGDIVYAISAAGTAVGSVIVQYSA